MRDACSCVRSSGRTVRGHDDGALRGREQGRDSGAEAPVGVERDVNLIKKNNGPLHTDGVIEREGQNQSKKRANT